MENKLNLIVLFLLLVLLTACKTENEQIPTKSNEELIIAAYNHHINSHSFIVTGQGIIKSKLITQNIKVIKEKDNDNLYYYNASYGSRLGIKVNSYIEAQGTFSQLVLSTGLSDDSLEILKEEETGKISHTEYIEIYGVGINGFNYIINEETILDIIADENDSKNTFRVILDAEKAAVNYKTHISAMNPYENNPAKTTFKKVELIITLDNQNRFKEITYIEEYEVSVKVLTWIKQSLSAEINEQYTYPSES